jgi:CubicO group peptidase (beta-lactamase class C family)
MHHFYVKLLVLLLSVLALAPVANAQITSAKIDQLVESAMMKFKVAGVAVGVVKDGKIIHNKGYGVKSIETREKVNQHTLFAIASNSKAFTATALSILVEDGKLSWQDKVKDHIPEFRMYNYYVTENFNIQDLLTHRSGLGLGVGDLMFFPDGNNFTVKDVLSGFQHFEPRSAFRTKYDYDNLLYIVAGEVVARVSGMSWDEFVEKRIMRPLSMNNTYSTFSLIKDKSNLALPHTTEAGVLRTINSFEDAKSGAAGGIYSNVDDLTKWMLVQLNKGRYGEKKDKKLFSEASQREMWKIHTTLPAYSHPRYNSHFAGYGLGWFLKDMKGNMSVSHTGGLPGMLSQTTLIPDLNLGVVVLTNTSDGGAGVFSAVTQTIIDSYLGLEDFGWTDYYYKGMESQQHLADSVTNKVWATVKAASSKKIETEDYIGVYEDKWFGKVEVFLKDKQLWFKSYRSPRLNGPMHYYKANTFAIKWEYQDMNGDAFAIFTMDEEGKAQSIKMKGISPSIDFSFDFQDLDLRRVNSPIPNIADIH